MRLGINWAAAQTTAVLFTEITEVGRPIKYWCSGLRLTGHEPYLLGTDSGPNKYPSQAEALNAANEWVRKHFPTQKEARTHE